MYMFIVCYKLIVKLFCNEKLSLKFFDCRHLLTKTTIQKITKLQKLWMCFLRSTSYKRNIIFEIPDKLKNCCPVSVISDTGRPKYRPIEWKQPSYLGMSELSIWHLASYTVNKIPVVGLHASIIAQYIVELVHLSACIGPMEIIWYECR